jgi:hypothetical protein
MRKNITLILLFLSLGAAINGDYVTISYYSTPIKILPHDDAYKLGNAQKGDTFRILQKEGDWYHIQYNNLPAWVHSRYVVEPQRDAAAEKDASTAPLPEQNTPAKPIQEKPIPPAPEPGSQQNYMKKGMETGQPRKAAGKGQSKQPHDNAPIAKIPGKRDTLPAELNQRGNAPQEIKTPVLAGSPDQLTPDKREATIPLPLIEIIIAILAAIGVALLIIFLLKGKRPQKRTIRNGPSRPGLDALIIAKSQVSIFNRLTNSTVPLTEFLSEMGLKVHSHPDLSNARTYLLHYVPDVVIVDWKLEHNLQTSIASILSESKTTVNIAVIFYNVPNPSSMSSEDGTIMQAHFLGVALSDQDISKIVVPLFRFSKKEKRFKESVQATALEGEIQKGNLAEVLQFIEMGKKTGCLYVVVDSPYGLIYFEQGRILYAASPSDKGRNAVINMLDLEKGYFHFVMNKVSTNRNCNHSCLEIVAEWTRIHDEADHGQEAPGNNKKKS